MKSVTSLLKNSLGRSLIVGLSAVAPLALAGCGDLFFPPFIGSPSGTPLTEFSEPIPGPSAEGPLAVLRSAVSPLPEATAVNPARVTLGRRLFHDPILSGDGTLSCSSCHSLDHGGAEARVSSVGIRGQVGPINSPTVLNARYHFVQFWDGRAADLREQAGGPIANPGEMGSSLEAAVAALGRSPQYPALFAAAYSDGITADNLRDAIAAYEETLVTPSRVDRFLKGDEHALSADERAGAELFVSTGCVTCHQGVNFGGTSFQRMGAVRNYFAERGTPLTEADNGRYNRTHNEADRHFFKVPTLRNVALTGPYLHDGSRATLDDAVRVMARYQLGRELTAEQVAHLVSFLTALTGELPADARLPAGELPPSAAPVAAPVAAPGAPAAAPAAPAAARPAAAAAH